MTNRHKIIVFVGVVMILVNNFMENISVWFD